MKAKALVSVSSLRDATSLLHHHRRRCECDAEACLCKPACCIVWLTSRRRHCCRCRCCCLNRTADRLDSDVWCLLCGGMWCVLSLEASSLSTCCGDVSTSLVRRNCSLRCANCRRPCSVLLDKRRRGTDRATDSSTLSTRACFCTCTDRRNSVLACTDFYRRNPRRKCTSSTKRKMMTTTTMSRFRSTRCCCCCSNCCCHWLNCSREVSDQRPQCIRSRGTCVRRNLRRVPAEESVRIRRRFSLQQTSIRFQRSDRWCTGCDRCNAADCRRSRRIPRYT